MLEQSCVWANQAHILNEISSIYMHQGISMLAHTVSKFCLLIPHILGLVSLRRATFPQSRFFRSRHTAFQSCRRIIVFQEVRIPWLTYRVRLMLKRNVALFGKQFNSNCAIQAGRKAQRRELMRIVWCAVEQSDNVPEQDREIP